MKIIGLDVGEKRIGVARVDSDTRIAVPVGFVVVDGSEWQEIARIARLNSTNLFVLGLPRSNEGNETKQSQYVKDFAKKLASNVPGAKIQFQDESLTSVEAENRLKSRKKPYQRGDIDAEAAAIILQDFVEHFGRVALDSSSSDTLPRAQGALDATACPSDTLRAALAKSLRSAEHTVASNAPSADNKKSGKVKLAAAITISVVALGILGLVGGLKLRDFIRAEREKEYARQEAEMKAEVFNFTIRPGETIFDIKKNLVAVGYSAEEIDAAFVAEYDFEFLKERPEGASLEGYLYPETHEFYADATVSEVLKKFLEGMATVISENNLTERYLAHGLTLHQGVTLASVVQKESGTPADQATVAQVFYSRLAYGWRIGSDVTVSYALDVVDPDRLVYKDNAAALTIDSCYNTRLYAGLPCGPISNPGLSALVAVAEPTDTAYLYFLTGDDGLMYYSYTEAEHNQNIYLHCQTLCNVAL